MREGKGGETDLNQHSNTKWCLICRATIGPSKSIPYKHFLYILEQKMRQRKERGKVEGIGFYPLIHVPNDHKSLGLGQNRARVRNFYLVSYMGGGDQRTWGIFWCFSRHNSRETGGKWRPWN